MLLASGRVAAIGIACTWHPGHDSAAYVRPRLTDVFASAANTGIIRILRLPVDGDAEQPVRRACTGRRQTFDYRAERRIRRAHMTPMPVTERDGAPELVGMIWVTRKVTPLIDPGADQQIGARRQRPFIGRRPGGAA